jgi:hypothetical protein
MAMAGGGASALQESLPLTSGALPTTYDLQQDELDALEALCFLSAGGATPPAAAHQHPHQQRTHTKRSPRTKQQKPSRASARARQQQFKQQQQRPARKQQREQQPASNVRHSPGSTSSGVTHSAHAAQLAEQQQLAVEDIHPAALPDPRLAGVVQQQQQQQQALVQQLQPTATAAMPMPASPQELQQVQAQYASWPAGVVGGGVPLPHLLLPPAPAAAPPAADVAALQLAALAAVTSAGASLDVGGLVQQLASLAPVAPLMQGLLAPVLQQVPPQPQPHVVVPRPPVKGCFWHVYIANMIESARKQKEQQQPQAALPPPPARAANKRAAMMPPPRPPAPPTAGQDAALHKKRRMQQQAQQQRQQAQRQQVAAAANPLAGVKAADPLGALLACSTAPGVGGLLGGLLGLPPVAAASLPLLGGQLARPAGGGLPAMQLFGGLQASPLLPLLPALAGMHGLAGC